MNRPLFALIFIALVALILFGMWWGWRARSRRDQHVAATKPTFTGTTIAEFSRIMYVSTTPLGQPLVRVAAPGLRYRGFSKIRVFSDGVEITVTGENPVRLSAEQVGGTGSARVRVGKAVERSGLTLLQWTESERAYESTFRFEDHDTERRFVDAITSLVNSTPGVNTTDTSKTPDFSQITQEDVR